MDALSTLMSARERQHSTFIGPERATTPHSCSNNLCSIPIAEWSQSCRPGSRAVEIHAGGHLIWLGRDSAFGQKAHNTLDAPALRNADTTYRNIRL